MTMVSTKGTRPFLLLLLYCYAKEKLSDASKNGHHVLSNETGSYSIDDYDTFICR